MKNKKNKLLALCIMLSSVHINNVCVSDRPTQDPRAQELSKMFNQEESAKKIEPAKPREQEKVITPQLSTDLAAGPTQELLKTLSQEESAKEKEPAKPNEQQKVTTPQLPTDLVGPAQEVPRYKEETKKQKKKKSRKKDIFIKFDYKDKPLQEIIEEVARAQGRNVVLPQGANAIKQKITFKLENQIPVAQAENYIRLFLHLSDYVMYPEGSFWIIEKQSPKNLTRLPYSLYINVEPEDLPDNDQVIRAIYYLRNLQVPKSTRSSEPLSQILNEMLSENSFLFDPKSNGIILTGSSNKIASVMKIITELDTTGAREVIEMFPLYNSSADTVAALLTKQVLALSGDSKRSISAHADSQFFFHPDTRIVADKRSNSLIVMGKETAVLRVKEFVQEYIDAPQDTGRSILHVYDLQYLDSEKFAKTLQDIVSAKGIGKGQAERELGPQRFFSGVKIIAETMKEAETAKTIEGKNAFAHEGKVKVGGNRLIIASTNTDWKRIKPLIQDLDKPQKQVIIEVFIVDLTVRDNRQLWSQLRKPNGIGLPENLGFQAAHIISPILNNTSSSSPATTLNADLLRLLLGSPADTSLAFRQTSGTEEAGGTPGAMILSFKDPTQESIWSVLKILEEWSEVKIISHPFLVTRNNVRSEEISTDIRRSRGALSSLETVTTNVKEEDFTATFKVAATPRLSSANRMNLQISVEITDFISTSGFTRSERKMHTNFNISSGQMIVIGGISQLRMSKGNRQTPILGQIPIIGNFFRGRQKDATKSNLAIFIHPTIVEPKIREGMHKFTSDKIKFGKENLQPDSLFANMKDPVTRLFFKDKPGESDQHLLNNYLKRIEYNKQEELLKEYSDPKYSAPDLDSAVLPEDKAQKLKDLLREESNPLKKESLDLKSPEESGLRATGPR